MGRPKKAEGIDIIPPSTSPNLPSSVDSPESPNIQNMTNPACSSSSPRGLDDKQEDSTHMTMNCGKIKTEDERHNCEYEERNASWNQSRNTRWPTCQQTSSNGKAQNVLASNDFIEEEMDELLMILQNDNQTYDANVVRNWKQGNKKMRSFDYTQMEAIKGMKEEYQSPPAQGLWNMDMPVNSGMTSSSMGLNEPMNMSASHMAKQHIHNRPPPQYPGYQNDYQQNQMHVGQQVMQVSPCTSPHSSGAQMHSPGGYMSDSQSVGSPSVPMAHSPGGYVSEGSPVHSPPYQFSPSPQHSPYHNPHSPQHGSYNDGSQQESPYHEPVYNQQPFSHSTPYQQPVNNLSVNCSQNNMAATSPMMSPSYNTHQMTARNSSMPMTIPNQEGRSNITSNGSWGGMQKDPLSPQMSFFSHSHPSCPATIPTQERGFRQNLSHHSQKRLVSFENLQRINQYFLTSLHCSEACLELLDDEDLDGSLTRNDIEKEVVYKTLASVTPAGSYHYVLNGEYGSDDNCSSSSLDEFTSCRRQNKRKYCDDSDICESSRCEAGVQIGHYKRQLTEKYWREANIGTDFPLTKDKQTILEHLSSVFRQMTDKYMESRNTACMTQVGKVTI